MELSAVPCSETSLLVKVVDNSLVTVGGYLPKLMEAGSDFDRSTKPMRDGAMGVDHPAKRRDYNGQTFFCGQNL